MSDQDKLALLDFLSKNAELGQPTRLSFNSLSKSLGLSKPVLDQLLTELNRGRFIGQYSKKGVDGFTLVMNQKGLDAAQDESFI